MSYKKDPKTGKWLVQYGKRNPKTGSVVLLRRKNVETEAEARKVERELIIKVTEKIHEKVIPRWEEAIDSYLDQCRDNGLLITTVYNAEKCLKKQTKCWNGRLIDSITTAEIRDLIKGPTINSVSHRKTMLKFVKGVFNVALENGLLLRNPAPMIKFKISDKIKTALTKEQARFLLTKGKEYDWTWYPHVCFALYTGMRNGELFALTWDKVCLENNTILVDSSWTKRDGLKSTKSGDDRIVEIAEPLLPVLKTLKVQSSGSQYVLPRAPRWDRGEQARELRMFMIGIGMSPVRFHDLRATWATLMLAGGQAPAKVMTMGGWKDLKTMMIYMRKAGIDIKGITKGFQLHDPVYREDVVIDLQSRRN